MIVATNLRSVADHCVYAGQQIETRASCPLRTDLLQPQALRFTTRQRFFTMRLANANSYTIRMNV
jgi:hypothetical protein